MDATTKATIPTIAATGSANMRYARRISGKWPRNAPIIAMHRIPTKRLTAKEIPVIPKVIMMTRGKMPTRLGTELSGPWPVDEATGFAAFAIDLAYYDLAYDLACTLQVTPLRTQIRLPEVSLAESAGCATIKLWLRLPQLQRGLRPRWFIRPRFRARRTASVTRPPAK